MTKHVSCRLPRNLGERVDEAAMAEGTVRSDIVRKAIRHYLDEGPGGASSPPTNSEEKQAGHPSKNARTSDSKRSVYDPSRDLR